MSMNFFGIKTVFTVIKIIAGFAFESLPCDRIHEATIAAYALMTTWNQFHLCYDPSPIALMWEIYTHVPSVATYI
jgi:hypothetical protein